MSDFLPLTPEQRDAVIDALTALTFDPDSALPLEPAALDAASATATVQLGDRVSVSTQHLIAVTKERTGMTRRAIIERAIRETWGDAAKS